MKIRFVRTVAVALGLWAVTASAAQAQAPVVNPPGVSGANVTLSWSGTAGATSYNIQVGFAPGAYIEQFNVGNITSIAVTAPLVATYYVRLVALPGGETSNEIAIAVTSLVTPPSAPTGLQVFRNNTSVIITWTPGAGGGPVAGYRLRAGLTPGGAEVGVLPTGAPGFAGGPVAAGTYYLGVAAVNAGGQSAESAEAILAMPANGACDTPPTPALTTSAWGPYLTASWSAVPGAAAFFFHAKGPGFDGLAAAIPGSQSTFTYYGLPPGNWAFGVQAQFACGALGGAGISNLIADGTALKLTPRAPDPAHDIPSYAAGVVSDIGRRFDGDLQRSCREHGGNNRWLFRLVAELRTYDKRWGLNWKRANVGDMSQDVVTYNWGDEADEGTFKLRAWDVIGNHCGSGRAGAQFSEITNPKPPNFSFGARWTLIPYIQAGNTP